MAPSEPETVHGFTDEEVSTWVTDNTAYTRKIGAIKGTATKASNAILDLHLDEVQKDNELVSPLRARAKELLNKIDRAFAALDAVIQAFDDGYKNHDNPAASKEEVVDRHDKARRDLLAGVDPAQKVAEAFLLRTEDFDHTFVDRDDILAPTPGGAALARQGAELTAGAGVPAAMSTLRPGDLEAGLAHGAAVRDFQFLEHTIQRHRVKVLELVKEKGRLSTLRRSRLAIEAAIPQLSKVARVVLRGMEDAAHRVTFQGRFDALDDLANDTVALANDHREGRPDEQSSTVRSVTTDASEDRAATRANYLADRQVTRAAATTPAPTPAASAAAAAAQGLDPRATAYTAAHSSNDKARDHNAKQARHVGFVPSRARVDEAADQELRVSAPGQHQFIRDPRVDLSIYNEPYDENWVANLDISNCARPYKSGKFFSRPEPFLGNPATWRKWRAKFYALVHNTPNGVDEKLQTLQELVQDPILKGLLANFTVGPAHYVAALQCVEDHVGQAADERNALYQELLHLSAPGESDSYALVQFCIAAKNILDVMVLSDESLQAETQIVIGKLPDLQRAGWRKRVRKGERAGFPPGIKDFILYLRDTVDDYKSFKVARQAKPATAVSTSGGTARGAGRDQRQGGVHAATIMPASSAGTSHGGAVSKDYGAKIAAKEGRAVTFTAPASSAAGDSSANSVCANCDRLGHNIKQCRAFKKLDVGARWRRLFEIKPELCFRCLRPGHRALECGNNDAVCSICEEKRHCTLLHKGEHDRSANAATTDSAGSTATRTVTSAALTTGVEISLGIVEGDVVVGNRLTRAKIFMDKGSQGTLVSESFRKRAGIKCGREVDAILRGVGGQESRFRANEVAIMVRPVQEGFSDITLHAVTKPGTTTARMTRVDWSLEKEAYPHLKDLPLPSPGYGEYPDILVGLDHPYLHHALDARYGQMNDPFATKTPLGWMVQGPVGSLEIERVTLQRGSNQANLHRAISSNFISTDFDDLTGRDLAERFFDGESFGTEFRHGHESRDTKVWEQIKGGIHQLQGEPGYVADLPWKDGMEPLTSNRRSVEGQLNSLRRKLDGNPEADARYEAKLMKYVEAGYAVERYQYDPRKMPCVGDLLLESGQHLIPHHLVLKKSDGKERIVFNSSNAEETGGTMNDRLHVGPKLQIEIPTCLTRWREFPAACGADIEAMFSRIRLNSADSKLHQFLWRKKGEKVNTVFQMTRVTFGDGPSPCIAIAVLHQIAEDYAKDLPAAAEVIKNGLYVDDLWHSEPNVDLLSEKMHNVAGVLAKGDMHLRHWTSNREDFKAPGPLAETDRSAVAVLGMRWDLQDDTLFHALPVDATVNTVYTKRAVLSDVASLFSPEGLAALYSVSAKIHLKNLHLTGLRWDDDFSDLGDSARDDFYEVQRKFWKLWREGLVKFCARKFRRCLQPFGAIIVSCQLHIFGDASVEAFAAVAYLRTRHSDGVVIVNIVCAKTKVSKKKTVSVDKVELDAALLASRMAMSKGEVLRVRVSQRFFWTDSSCVRQWIRSVSSFYKTFVSNRIGEIQTLTQPDEWRFVPGKLNPADIATRSTLDTSDETFERWVKGPDFLQEDELAWPADIVKEDILLERRSQFERVAIINVARVAELSPEEKYKSENFLRYDATSDYPRLLRTVVRFLRNRRRWVARIRGSQDMLPDVRDLISVADLKDAEEHLIKAQQGVDFAMEVGMLQAGEKLSPQSRLLPLTPFLDDCGLLRVGGRLSRFKLPYDCRHPLLLLPGPLAALIVGRLHREHHHPGVNHLWGIVRERYWIVGGRELCKKIGRQCLDCHRERAEPLRQLMADLPPIRDTRRPFSHVSVDLFGPYQVRLGTARQGLRGAVRTELRYGVIFTCLACRGVFIVAAESASTAHFLNTLRLLESVRGRPDILYSDNGLNFVGAGRVLAVTMEAWGTDPEFVGHLVKRGIEWQRYPPGAPHMGGVHEALVKSAKRAFNRCLQPDQRRRLLTESELNLLFAEVTSFLNNRPLTFVSSDPKDGVLTPNSLMNARSLVVESPPGVQALTTKGARDSYQLIQATANEYWKVWQQEYLPNLLTRNKWRQDERNARVGDVVMITEPNSPRNYWPIGRVIEVFPDRNGHVRSVLVRTAKGDYRRPIVRCCLLEAADENVGAGADVPEVHLAPDAED